MRHTLLISLLALALPVAAQTPAPANLEPLPEPPPPPAMVEGDADLAPQVTITQRGEDKVEEYRVNGRLYMLKVTPPNGSSYYLIDRSGDGTMTRQDSLDTRLSVPMWVIKNF